MSWVKLIRLLLLLITVAVILLVTGISNTQSKWIRNNLFSKKGMSEVTRNHSSLAASQRKSADVINRALELFNIHNCSDNSTEPPQELNVCGGDALKNSERRELVLLTSMYHSKQKQHVFRFVLGIWSLFLPQVLPVLYLTDVEFVHESEELLRLACDKGWTVNLAPWCLPSGFPLLNHMYQHAAQHYHAHWYGFSNGDILHTDRVAATLKILRERPPSPTIPKISFVTSRRCNAYVSPTDSVSTIADVYNLAKNLRLYRTDAIDVFIYRRNMTVFQQMPSFAIARRGYDNWLVFAALTQGLNALDITQLTPTVHLGIKGKTDQQNSHTSRPVDQEYNVLLEEVKRSKNWYDIGRLDCIPYQALKKRVGKGFDIRKKGVLQKACRDLIR